MVKNITLSSKSKNRIDSLYLPGVRRGASKGHGIIRINLNQVCGHDLLLGVDVHGYRELQDERCLHTFIYLVLKAPHWPHIMCGDIYRQT